MNLTTSNIDNRLVLAECCYADYAIKYLEKQNIGDLEQASCYMNKMRQLYFSMEALHDFTPSSELAPSVTSSFGGGTVTGEFIFYADGEQISDALTFSSTADALATVTAVNSINTYQSDYIASISGSNFVITSALSGTTNNGVEISLTQNGAVFLSGDLAGGLDQWCLDDTKAELILENIDELCGCPCSDCDDILSDELPRYIN